MKQLQVAVLPSVQPRCRQRTPPGRRSCRKAAAVSAAKASVGVLVGGLILQSVRAGDIAFPNALDAAAVQQDRLDEIHRRALPLGNGDLNALLCDRDGVLCLRLTKNDIWDARIDTSQDPPLLRMDVRDRSWSGGSDRVSSWSDHPYPQPRCAAVIRIGSAEQKEPVTQAHLDLRRAVARANNTTVRILADRNVVLVDGGRPITLEEVKARELPPAQLGETDGAKWLHMKMPGDADYPGMEYAIAVAARGTRQAVGVATSFDTRGPVLAAAVDLAREGFKEDAVSRHETVWEKFWAASGLELGDPFFQDAWYRNLYYMRCFASADSPLPIMLFAGLSKDETPWHGAPTLDYNFQQTFWPMFVCNHADLAEPYVRFLQNYAPRGRWLARQTYRVDGLFLPVNIFGPEHLVAPDKAKSNNARQICYVPWSYALGCTGWALQNVWWRYTYAPDREYLESVYPLFRDGAEFYANILEQCRDGELGPSYNPEHGPFGTFNNPVDLAYVRFLLATAAEAAGLLKRDATLAQRWRRQSARVPAYETTLFEGKTIVADWKGATADSVPEHNVVVPTVPIFPAEQVTWFSPDSEKQLFERTLRWVKFHDFNSHIMANVQRARFSMPEAFTRAREHFAKLLTPNGLFAEWPGHGSYLSESWAFAGLTGELLLQSVDDIIRVFPAWPLEHDAAFVDLRAQGGLLVSAEQKSGRIGCVAIEATVAKTARVLNPWPDQPVVAVNATTGKQAPGMSYANRVLTFQVNAGQLYHVKPESDAAWKYNP